MKKRTNKVWARFNLGRNTGKRGDPKKRILIVCEGEKTEPNYFRSFRVTSAVVVKVVGLGTDTKKLVEKAITRKEESKRKKEKFDQVWCVFDRDSFSANDFRKAFELANQNDIKIAYSNEAFELWYLLHFSYFTSAVTRKLYVSKLSTSLQKQYSKNSTTMYDQLISKQANAIKNAKKLLASYSEDNPEKNNPSTTVFELVEELNKNL